MIACMCTSAEGDEDQGHLINLLTQETYTPFMTQRKCYCTAVVIRGLSTLECRDFVC